MGTQKQELKTKNPSQREQTSKSDVHKSKNKQRQNTMKVKADIHPQKKETEYQEFDLSNPSITSDSNTSSDSDDSQTTSDTNDSSETGSETGNTTSESGSSEMEESEDSSSESDNSDTSSESTSDTGSSDSDDVESKNNRPLIKNQTIKSISHTNIKTDKKNRKIQTIHSRTINQRG